MTDSILYIDDEQNNLEVFRVVFFEEFDIHIATDTKKAYRILQENNIKVVLTDQRMPNESGIDFIDRVHDDFPDVVFIIISAYTDFDVARKAIENGAVFRFLLKPWNEDEVKLDLRNAIEKYDYLRQNKELVKSLAKQNKELDLLRQKLEAENSYLKEEIKEDRNFGNIITVDKTFKNILDQIERVATTDAAVFITGETGTGKELVARALHDLSRRKHEAFIGINCAAIPEALFESELFGYEKGAFTSAFGQKKGKLELANNGTLFLDELGEMPLAMQAKLLRAIQEQEIERLGSTSKIKLNVRFVSATNQDVEENIEVGKFRSDLFFRLNVFPVNLPPLRDRLDDIPLLLRYFVVKFCKRNHKKIKSVPKRVEEELKLYSWPGNVREFENVIERAVIVSDGDSLDIRSMLPIKKDGSKQNYIKLEDVERKHILSVLKRTSWKIGGTNGAATLLGLNRTTLIARMKKLGLKRPI